MEPTQNTLLNALGAYDSDEDSSGSGSEENTLTASKTDPVEHMQNEKDNAAAEQVSVAEDMEEDEDSDENESEGSPHLMYGANREGVEQYQATKRDIDVLLGCDQVKDTLQLPEDTPECSAELQAKFAHWYDLRQEGANFNDTLMRNKTFRNPNIYKWLVDHLKLEEAGSNFDEQGFDAAQLRNDFEPKALAEDQERRAREYAARKSAEAAAGNLRKIEFQPAAHGHVHAHAGVSAGAGSVAPVHGYNNSIGSGTKQYSGQPRNASMQNTKSFSDALERAKLIAQHLSRPKGQ
ncbi:SAP30-binding protein [Coemansia sp. RSA 1722]|nr:SAP30-binding protein [Coemansia sp. RSA 486]KAJ2600223.1 SAP30-binding protein [Coemansia sp. RSA 1722]